MTNALGNSPHGQDNCYRLDGNSKGQTSILGMPQKRDEVGGTSGPTDITPFQKMLSATTGSLLTGLTMTPLDVVRVRWQSQSVRQRQHASRTAPDFHNFSIQATHFSRTSNAGGTSCCREVFMMNSNAQVCVVGPYLDKPASIDCAVQETKMRTFSSTFDGMRKIARNEGFWTLWRGLSPTLLMAIPANMIYFVGYEWLRFDNKSPLARMNDSYAPLIAGAIARVVAATAIGPIELFRTRLQASLGDTTTGHVKYTLNSMQEIVKSHGYRSLWRGLSLTLWRDVPFSGMYWWGYETIRGKLTEVRESRKRRSYDGDVCVGRLPQRNGNHRDTFVDSSLAGALSGALACITTMPFDVGKTRTQVCQDSGKNAAGEMAKGCTVPKDQTMFRLLRHIVRTEGVAGLFRGWMPRVMKVAPACAIMISSFEVGKKVFADINKRSPDKEKQKGQEND